MPKENNKDKIKNTELVKSPNSFPVVGIGASAGGLDAFKKLLKAIPENSGMAYVLVQHLDPNHESMLPELLQKVTNIPVLEISDDIKVEPDHIYIIPSNKMLISKDSVLELSPRPAKNKTERNLTIDLFFTSLAEVHQSHAIGVVLSGTASDGTLGLKAIKDHGGITFAQDEESAQYEGMPHSAVQAGVVDFILPPEQIPRKLLEVSNTINGNVEENVPQQHEDVFKQILSLLRLRKGTDFTYYKQTTIRRRILRRMALNKNEEPAGYLKFLRESKPEQDVLYQDLLIPVTSFFRDAKSFDNLCETVFPSIVKNKATGKSIRVWVAGCSNGQEVYSLAICLKEYLTQTPSKGVGLVQIFATDINEPAIAKARTGMYSKSEVDGLTPWRLQEFFTKTNGSYQVNKSIKDMCVFAVHNFFKDPPFGKLDFISCRNVLIYMEPSLQKKALTTFHYALNNNGFLWLGKSETISSVPELFGISHKGDKIFTRKDVPGKYMHSATLRSEQGFADLNVNAKNENIRTDYQKSADDIMLTRFTPAGVVVNEDMDIVHFRGKTGAYLEQGPGKPSLNLLKMAKEGLAFELRNILHKAKKGKTPVIKENIPRDVKGNRHLISIEAIPLINTIEPHYLVLFHEILNLNPDSYGDQTPNSKVSSRIKKNEYSLRIQQLEKELAQAREDMRSITEDQEVMNEELQSANEELLSGSEELQSLNEELETSKEELQSTNEELTIVNQELTSLNAMVTSSARDFAKTIVTTTLREPLLVLDKNLRVKTANKSFYRTFLVNEQETEGKLFYSLGNRQWDIPQLRILLEAILPEKKSFADFQVEHYFKDIGQRSMLINGQEMIGETGSEKLILLSIEDITERKEAEQDRFVLSAVVESSDDAIISKTLDGIINSWNKGAKQIFGYSPQEVIGKNIRLLIPQELQQEEEMVIDKIKQGLQVLHFETERIAKDGRRISISLTVSPVKDKTGKIIGASKIARDITEQKAARTMLEYRKALLEAHNEATADGILLVDAKGKILSYNHRFIEIWNMPQYIVDAKDDESALSYAMTQLVHPEQFIEKVKYLYEHPTETSMDELEYKDGKIVERHGYPVVAEDGSYYAWSWTFRDITEIKKAELVLRQSEENFRQLAELMPDKITTADADGNTNYYNQNWFDYTGFTSEQLLKESWARIMHPDDLEEIKKRWHHSLETGNDFEMEFRILNKTGKYKWHLSRASAVKNKDGKITKWISTATEIQGQKEQRDKLEKAVLERTAELLQANNDLSNMNKELQSFAYISSHDLQEPLRKIQTFGSYILEKERQNLTGTGKDYFNRMQEAAKRMRILIDDLLTYSRTNTAERIFEKMPLNKIVDEVKTEFKETIEEKNAIIETGDMCEVSIIPFQFQQLFSNLIGNSLKFSIPAKPAHIIIKSKIGEGAVFNSEMLSPQKQYCHISITDNGIGFDPMYNERIFNVFQRLHNKDEYPGTGIGLAIVKKIVENHNGIITATGEINEGARFDIYIPVE